MEYKLQMVVGQNKAALAEKDTFPDKFTANPNDDRRGAGAGAHRLLRPAQDATRSAATLHGTGDAHAAQPRDRQVRGDADKLPYTGVIVGARADEEGSRSKERYFSPRDKNDDWDVGDQPPEFWNQFKTDFAPGTHVRIHPLLDWTELNIWEYIKRENIPTVSLYYDQGDGTRYRSLGCGPCQRADQEQVEERRRHHHRTEERHAQEYRRALGPHAGRQARSRRAAPQRLHVIMNPHAPRAAWRVQRS